MVMWYFVDGAHNRQGPMTAEALAEAFRRGQVLRESLVWREGMAQWEPLQAHLHELPQAAPPPAAPPVAAAPAGAPGPVASVAATAANDVVDAGFLRRLGAYVIDAMIVGGLFYAVFLVVIVATAVVSAGGGGNSELMAWGIGLAYLAYPVISLGYYATLESSKWQATVGKLALGIKVVDGEGHRLGWGRAAARWAGSLLSYLTLYIGFFMAGWTRRKQALHDLMAGTYVVDKWAYSDQPGLQKRGVNGVVVAVLAVALLLGGVMVMAVLAAIALPAYQDYVTRSKVAGIINDGRTAAVALDEFQLNTNRCPRDAAEASIEDIGNPLVREVLVIESDEGACELALVLAYDPSLKGAAGGVIYLREDGYGGRDCEAESVPDNMLPAGCR